MIDAKQEAESHESSPKVIYISIREVERLMVSVIWG